MELTKAIVVSKQCALSPDKDSTESKQFKVELTIPAGTTTQNMALAILKSEVIRFQNSQRNKYDKLVNNSMHKLTFKAPIGMIDPEQAMVAKLQAMTSEEQVEYLKKMVEKASK